jgi:hypothetical protein
MEIFDFAGTSIKTAVTNGTGHYLFTPFPSGNYTMEIAPSNAWGGVNSTDALLILNHFAHLDTLKGMELAAADVNYSQTINGTDALFVMKRYTTMITEFPSGDWLYNTEDLAINNNAITMDLSMLCFGDVNSSYLMPPSKDGGAVTLLTEGSQTIQSNEDFTVIISIKDAIEAGAVSLGLTYPEEYISITGAELQNVNSNAIYHSGAGMFRIGWADLNMVSYGSGDALLVLNCHANDLSSVQEPIVFGLFGNSEFADASATVINDVVMTAPELLPTTLGIENHTTEGIWLSGNFPNPFSNLTTIRYQLPATGNVTLKVYNLLGDLVSVLIDQQQAGGEYSATFDCEGLEPGIYIYKLEFQNTDSNFSLVNKMSVTR